MTAQPRPLPPAAVEELATAGLVAHIASVIKQAPDLLSSDPVLEAVRSKADELQLRPLVNADLSYVRRAIDRATAEIVVYFADPKDG